MLPIALMMNCRLLDTVTKLFVIWCLLTPPPLISTHLPPALNLGDTKLIFYPAAHVNARLKPGRLCIPPELSSPVIPCGNAKADKPGVRGWPIQPRQGQRRVSSPGSRLTSPRGLCTQEASGPGHPRTPTGGSTLGESAQQGGWIPGLSLAQPAV